MLLDLFGRQGWAERWDRLYKALLSELGRVSLYPLLHEPWGRRLPLAEAANSPDQSKDANTLHTQLLHRHLPLLAEAGYVRWEKEPFVPQFEELACIINLMSDSLDELLMPLTTNCKIFQKRVQSD